MVLPDVYVVWGGKMPAQRMQDLCAKIAAEKNPKKLIALTDELLMLLSEEQSAIKQNIAKRLSNVVSGAA
jgi:hypothetical protein